MKIALTITAFIGRNTGVGGHYYSCLCLAKALVSAGHEVKIYCIGDLIAPALKNSDVEVVQVVMPSHVRNFLRTVKLLTTELSRDEPDVVHAFNQSAYFYSRFACKKLELALVLTKPGGKSSNSAYHPYADQFVVFTQDDLDIFSNSKMFSKQGSIHWIPNRVLPPSLNRSRVEELNALLPGDDFTFLLISRLSTSKRILFEKAINLVRYLRRKDFKFRLVVIGTPDSQELKSRIENAQLDEIVLLCDPPFTTRSSDYIPVADCVLAMGRGVMEAAAWGKPVMVPTGSSKDPYPVLLNEDTFDCSFKANFTERATFSQESLSSARDDIDQMIRNKAYYEESSAFAKNLFDEYFNIITKTDTYLELYQSTMPYRKDLRVDELKHVFNRIVINQLRSKLKQIRNKKK